MRRAKRLGLVLTVAFACGPLGVALQRNTPPPVPPPDLYGRPSSSSGNQPKSPFDEQGMQAMEEKRSKSMNNERQRLMVKDADQLVQSAAELEARVTNDPKGAAREDEGKRAEMIEKLAKSVKDRMRGLR